MLQHNVSLPCCVQRGVVVEELRWSGPLTSSQCGTVHVSVNCAYLYQEVHQQHTREVAKMVASTLSVGDASGFAGMFPLIG